MRKVTIKKAIAPLQKVKVEKLDPEPINEVAMEINPKTGEPLRRSRRLRKERFVLPKVKTRATAIKRFKIEPAKIEIKTERIEMVNAEGGAAGEKEEMSLLRIAEQSYYKEGGGIPGLISVLILDMKYNFV